MKLTCSNCGKQSECPPEIALILQIFGSSTIFCEICSKAQDYNHDFKPIPLEA